MKYAGACKKILPQATSVTPQIKIRKGMPQADVLVQETQPPMLEKHTLARSFVSTNDKNLITQTTFIARIFQYVLQCVFSRFRYSLARRHVESKMQGLFLPLNDCAKFMLKQKIQHQQTSTNALSVLMARRQNE